MGIARFRAPTFHDSTSTECFVELQVASKCRNRRDHDNHLVLLAISGSADDALNNSRANLVLDRFLLIACSSDEKLVLDVNKVLAVADNLAVGVLDGMLLDEVSSGLLNVSQYFY